MAEICLSHVDSAHGKLKNMIGGRLKRSASVTLTVRTYGSRKKRRRVYKLRARAPVAPKMPTGDAAKTVDIS